MGLSETERSGLCTQLRGKPLGELQALGPGAVAGGAVDVAGGAYDLEAAAPGRGKLPGSFQRDVLVVLAGDDQGRQGERTQGERSEAGGVDRIARRLDVAR